MEFELSGWRFILLFAFLASTKVRAADYLGRVSVGTFTSIERFSSQDEASDSNDFQTASGRLYLRVYDIGEGQWDFVSDLRDKYDQFSELNQSQFQLDPKNFFQVRQLYSGNFSSKSVFNAQVGRFAVQEVGGQYVDGLALQARFGSRFRIGLTGGNSPMNDDTQELSSDPRATVTGAYLYYDPNDFQMTENLIVNYGIVSRCYDGEEDRRYVYQNLYYQWNRSSRVYSQTFFDSIPTAYVQTWSFNLDQGVSSQNIAHLHLMGVDAIQYRRISGIREQLEASPYRQALFQWDWQFSPKSRLSPSFLKGERQADQLAKDETKLKFLYADFESSNWETSGFLGRRNNFKSQDQFLGCGLGYYSASWEFTVDVESGSEVEATETLHPVQLGMSASYVKDRQYFFSFAGEYAKDERVTIMSFLAKLTYRFGSKEVPPLRDGAPVRRSL